MTFDPNNYMGRDYGALPCWLLVADVYRSELSLPVTDYRTINGSVRELAKAFSLALHKSPHGFGQIDEPVDFAVVLMGRTPRIGITHAGIYWHGHLLHALESGVLLQDMASVRDTYRVVEFWAKTGLPA